MFKIIEGLAPNVLGIEAAGKVTHEDYRDVFIPRAEALIATGPARMLYVIGKDFSGFELEALADDAAFGLKRLRDFSHLAVVSDHSVLNSMILMFKPFFQGEFRLFSLAELSAAKSWVTSAS
jgi:hypothetical protein